MRVCKLLLVVVSVSALLGASVTTATARNWEFSKQQMRKFFREVRFEGVFGATSCQLTLEGSVHSRTIPKVRETLIGYVTSAPVKEESCTNGRARGKNLPFHLTYEGFAGSLPNISSVFILLRGMRFEMIVSGICTVDYGLATDNVTGRANREAGSALTAIEPVAGRNILNRVSGTGFCPASGSLQGSGGVTILNGSTRVSVTLI